VGFFIVTILEKLALRFNLLNKMTKTVGVIELG
jgi:hypothetical protein